MKKKFVPYLFLMPSLAGVSIFSLIPFVDIVKRSFFDSSDTYFNGINNYSAVWNNDSYLLAIVNTFLFLIVSIITVMISSVILSNFFLQLKGIGQRFKMVFLIPLAIPAAATSLFWNLLFDSNGILNGIMHLLGGSTANWMNSPYSFWILVLLFVWKNLGFTVLLWMIGISSVSQQMSEAAEIDGANGFQIFIYIIFPNTRTTLYTSLLLLIINSFKVYRDSYLLAGDYPNKSMYMLQNILNNWFRNYDLGKMAAGAILCACILCIIILPLNKKLDV